MRTPTLAGLGMIGLGLTLLLIAILFPIIKQVECGFPSGVKITAALRNREDELRQAFATQKDDLGMSTHLLCDDPALATRLLEAAWSRAATGWRGPVVPDALRIYVLCVFVQMLNAHRRVVATNLLAVLGPQEKTAFVLHEFGGLTVAQIAELTQRPPVDISHSLGTAQVLLDRALQDGGPS
ncbi:RNA polymerase sigma factor [Kocuria sp. NPDC057446]|uniref:RNA polymerase sigma factor n=1 Tax=Kocuria sp. NPDC057446 TaxID=3346137 RepID=UPI0036CB9FB8